MRGLTLGAADEQVGQCEGAGDNSYRSSVREGAGVARSLPYGVRRLRLFRYRTSNGSTVPSRRLPKATPKSTTFAGTGSPLSANTRLGYLRRRYVFLSLLCIVCGCAPGTPRVEMSPTPTVISLERTRCFGTCPVYTVTVTAAGAAYFATDASARVDTVSVPPASVEALATAFDEARFFTLDSEYVPGRSTCPRAATDHPSAILTLQSSGRMHQVRHYHGCISGGNVPSDSVPDRLQNPRGVLGTLKLLAEQVDSVAGTAEWLRASR